MRVVLFQLLCLLESPSRISQEVPPEEVTYVRTVPSCQRHLPLYPTSPDSRLQYLDISKIKTFVPQSFA